MKSDFNLSAAALMPSSISSPASRIEARAPYMRVTGSAAGESSRSFASHVLPGIAFRFTEKEFD